MFTSAIQENDIEKQLKNNRKWIISSLLFIVFLIFEIYIVFEFFDYPLFNKKDQWYHFDQIASFIKGDDYNLAYNYRGFYWFFIIVSVLSGIDIFQAFIWIPIFLGALNPVLIFNLFNSAFENHERHAIIGSFLFEFHQYLIFRNVQGLPSTISLPFFIIALMTTFEKEKRMSTWIAVSLSGILSIFFHHLTGLMLLLVIPFLFWPNFIATRRKSSKSTRFQMSKFHISRETFEIVSMGLVLLLLNCFMLYFYGISLFIKTVAIIELFQTTGIVLLNMSFIIALFFYQMVLVPLFLRTLSSGPEMIGNLKKSLSNHFSKTFIIIMMGGELFLIYSAIIIWNNYLYIFSWSIWHISFLFGIRYFVMCDNLVEKKRLLGFLGFMVIYGVYFCASLASDYLIFVGSLDDLLGTGVIRQRIMQYLSIPLSMFSAIGINEIVTKKQQQLILKFNQFRSLAPKLSNFVTLFIISSFIISSVCGPTIDITAYVQREEISSFSWMKENASNRTYLVVPPLYGRFIPHYTNRNTTTYWNSIEIFYSDREIEELKSRILSFAESYDECWVVYSDYVSMPQIAQDNYEKINNSSQFIQIYNLDGIIIWKMNMTGI